MNGLVTSVNGSQLLIDVSVFLAIFERKNQNGSGKHAKPWYDMYKDYKRM